MGPGHIPRSILISMVNGASPCIKYSPEPFLSVNITAIYKLGVRRFMIKPQYLCFLVQDPQVYTLKCRDFLAQRSSEGACAIALITMKDTGSENSEMTL